MSETIENKRLTMRPLKWENVPCVEVRDFLKTADQNQFGQLHYSEVRIQLRRELSTQCSLPER